MSMLRLLATAREMATGHNSKNNNTNDNTNDKNKQQQAQHAFPRLIFHARSKPVSLLRYQGTDSGRQLLARLQHLNIL